MIEMSLRPSSFLALSHRQEIVDSDLLIDPARSPRMIRKTYRAIATMSFPIMDGHGGRDHRGA
jgi:hypothetical protein